MNRNSNPNIRTNTQNKDKIRIGCVNCGGKVGWSMGVEFFRKKDNLDIMFVLDTRMKTSSRPKFKNLIGETFSNDSHS